MNHESCTAAALAQIALDHGLLPADRHAECLRQIRESGGSRDGRWLVENGFLTPADLAIVRARFATATQSLSCFFIPTDGGSMKATLPSSRRPSAPPKKKPDTIGRFRLDEELGRGAMGVVYRARDTFLDAPVAVKLLPTHVAQDERLHRALQVEARNAALMRDHPNVVTVFEAGLAEDGRPYVAMELVEGETLADWVRNRGEDREADLDLIEQIAAGLAAAHERGLVHRDLKPANVMVGPDLTAKILDFGMSKNIAAPRAEQTMDSVVGTPLYMAPELLAMGLGVDTYEREAASCPRVDVYAFGVTVCEVLRRDNPFRGSETFGALLRRKRDLDSLADLRSEMEQIVGEGRARTVLHMIDPERFARPESMVAAGDRWRESAEGEPVTAILGGSFGATDQVDVADVPEPTSPTGLEWREEYWLSDRCIRLCHGSLTSVPAEAWVSSDDNGISMAGGVAAAIDDAAGPSVKKEARAQLPASPGDVLVTGAGRLRGKHVLHAITIDLTGPDVGWPDLEVIARCAKGVFSLARDKGIASIVMPALGAGTGRLDQHEVAAVLAVEMTRALREPDSPIREIVFSFVDGDDDFVRRFRIAILDSASDVCIRRPRA
ncbi:MAG: hypothetical protein CMJ83_15305 [Planctomycetes bacterium]|nr:hypothetical protein [Planctomycetota bacterium]